MAKAYPSLYTRMGAENSKKRGIFTAEIAERK
jgi:hypothetical protein